MSRDKSVLLITRYFPPLAGIASMRLFTWAKYLVRQGYDVQVLTTSKQGQVGVPLELKETGVRVEEVDYFDPIVAAGITSDSSAESSIHGGRGPKKWLKQLYRDKLNERVPSRTLFWPASAYRVLKRWEQQGREFGYVISSYGPPACHQIACRAKRLFGATWIADYRDLWLENHNYTGVWPFTLWESRLERRLVSQANRITTVSEGLADVLRCKFPHIPVSVIPNGFDPELMDRTPSEHLKGQRPVRLVYTGTFYSGRQDPSPLFSVLQALDRRGITTPNDLQIEFYGGRHDGLSELIDRYQLQRYVTHLGEVSVQACLQLQTDATALLFLEEPRPKIDGVLTGKLFEYIAAPTPVLAVGVDHHTAAGRVLDEVGGCWVCGTDQAAIEQALLDLLAGRVPPRKRERSLVDRFSRHRQVAQLIQLMEDSYDAAGTISTPRA